MHACRCACVGVFMHAHIMGGMNPQSNGSGTHGADSLNPLRARTPGGLHTLSFNNFTNCCIELRFG